ncbi:DUF3341 domain-containing protein [Microvirga sp. TS319]|uniref:DUF3341 domain-containing protein n=1 Tax=Microvirga sp. TS319 TaxID=3241165 RepID=UPI00351A39EE
MTAPLVAEFRDADALSRAALRIRDSGHRLIDAFTPLPVEGLAEIFDAKPSRIRWTMLIAGMAFAAVAYGLQWWSAVQDYPLNVGGRPLNSWPVFLLVPFEVGMLAAAFAGLIAFLRQCGLPRLHHPIFDVAGFERTSQDRFFLLIQEAPDGQEKNLRDVLFDSGAVMVSEVGP